MNLRICSSHEVKASSPSFSSQKKSTPPSYSTIVSMKNSANFSILKQFFSLFNKTKKHPESNEEIVRFKEFSSNILPTDFAKVSDLFFQLGTTSYEQWILNYSSLIKKQKEIENIHPLIFLYIVLCNQTQITHLLQFQKQSIKGAWLLKIKTGRAPWEEMILKLSQRMDKHRENISLRIYDFCKPLKFKPSKFSCLAKQRKWQEFILEAIKERESYFKR